MRRLLAAFICAALLTGSPAVADPPREHAGLKRLVDVVAGHKGKIGVAVVDLDTGELVMGHDADVPLNPASNMKIVTAWAALTELGPQHRYLTGLYGRIAGDRVPRLAIRGDGDPSLDHHHLWEMAARLHRAGVRKVGDVVVDQSAFDDQFTPPAFAQQPNEWASFRSPVAAVSVARNTVTFEIRPRGEGERASVSVIPASFVTQQGRVLTAAPGATDKLNIHLAPADGKLRATLAGGIPKSSRTTYVVRRVEDPRLLAGYALRDVLEQVGITVEGKIELGEKRGKLLSAHRSQSLAHLLHRLGKNSDNFYAEMIFKSLSADDDAPASFARSSTLVRKMLGDAGIDVGRLRFDNGSGLFDANRLTAAATAKLLRLAFHDPRIGPELVAQLSIGGTDGTLRARLKKLKGTGKFRAKTGTLNAVSALSGIVIAERRYAVSILLNDVGGKSVSLRRDMDRFVESLL